MIIKREIMRFKVKFNIRSIYMRILSLISRFIVNNYEIVNNNWMNYDININN